MWRKSQKVALTIMKFLGARYGQRRCFNIESMDSILFTSKCYSYRICIFEVIMYKKSGYCGILFIRNWHKLIVSSNIFWANGGGCRD